MGTGTIQEITSTKPESCIYWPGVSGNMEHDGHWTTVAVPNSGDCGAYLCLNPLSTTAALTRVWPQGNTAEQGREGRGQQN